MTRVIKIILGSEELFSGLVELLDDEALGRLVGKRLLAAARELKAGSRRTVEIVIEVVRE